MNGSYSTPVSIRLLVPALFLAASHSAEPCPIFWSTLYVHKCKGLWIGCGSRSPRELFCGDLAHQGGPMYVCRKMNNSQARTGHQRGMGGRGTDDDDTHERHTDTNKLTRHTASWLPHTLSWRTHNSRPRPPLSPPPAKVPKEQTRAQQHNRRQGRTREASAGSRNHLAHPKKKLRALPWPHPEARGLQPRN